MAHFLQTLISGLSLGSIYALIALGYTMVYGIAKMLNFAHGDIIMVGAYAVITAVFSMGMPPVVAVLFSIVICAVLGVLVEFLAYRPLRQAPPLTVLITAIGVSYFLQSVALLIFGSEQKAFPAIISLPTIKMCIRDRAYVYDENGDVYEKVNREMVSLEKVSRSVDVAELKELIEEHVRETGSEKGREILENFAQCLPKFKKIMPHDYSRMLGLINKYELKGLSYDQAVNSAFYEIKGGDM